MDLNNNTEDPEDQLEDQALLDAKDFVSQAKAKPQRRELAGFSSRIVPMDERNWTLSVFCIPKVARQKTGEVLYEKGSMSPRPPPKISLRHDWTKELGSKVDRQPEGEVARQAKIFQPTQPTPNPIRDRSGRLDDMQDGRNTSRSQEINVTSFKTREILSL